MQNRRSLGMGTALLALALGGCVANITSDGPNAGQAGGPVPPAGGGGGAGTGQVNAGAGSTTPDCTTPRVGGERIQRLTPREYTGSLRTLLANEELEPALDADREPVATLDAVRKWYNAADVAVPAASGWLASYGACDPGNDEACAKQLYEAFAQRAFRRPLTDDEREWLASSWAALPARASEVQRLEVMGELILQAPQFLYFYSEGTPVGAVNVLDDHARAERLSYFLWDAPPDADLLAAAAAGELTPAGMRAHAERLLDDERAKPVLRAFLADWLELGGATILPSLEDTPKDAKLFPGFDGVLRQSMRRELEMFMDHVMFEADGSMETLFTSTRAYVNAPLARLYGVQGGPTGSDDWAWVELNPTERAGMLTRAGFLAVHASQNVTSPIRRGVYLLKEVLCAPLPPPPANVDNTPLEVTGELKTVREATLQRTGSPSCGACHTRINELGFAFEHYDAIGRWQDAEAQTGARVSASADLSKSGSSLQGTIDGALELSALLAKSPEVAACATKRWFEVALRRSPVALDACSVQRIQAKVAETGSIRELLLALVESDAFLHVSHGEQAESP